MTQHTSSAHSSRLRSLLLTLAALLACLLGAILPSASADGVLCDQRDFLGSYDTPDEARSVTIVGTTAYVADRFSGLQIIDVSDPTMPVWLGEYDTPEWA